MIQRGIYSRIMVSTEYIYYILYYKHRLEVYYIYVFLFFTVLAKVTYCDLIARGGRASFNRKLYYFLITFFVSSSSRGENRNAEHTLHPTLSYRTLYTYTFVYWYTIYIFIMNRYIKYIYLCIYYI